MGKSLSDPYQWGSRVRVRVRIRRVRTDGTPWLVKAEAETLDGKEFELEYGWLMDEGDPYPGEIAWLFSIDEFRKHGLDVERAPMWLASGDLELLAPLRTED